MPQAVPINTGATTVSVAAEAGSGGTITFHSVPEVAGAAVTASNPLPVQMQIGTAPISSAAPMPVFQSDVRQADQPLDSTALNAVYLVPLNGGEAVVGFTIVGLTASTATLVVEGCNNIGSTSPVWTTISAVSGAVLFSALIADGAYRVEVGGRTAVRLRVSIVGTGSISVASTASIASSLVTMAQSLPTGTNALGSVRLTPAPVSSLSETLINSTTASSFALAAASSGKTNRLYRIFMFFPSATTIQILDGSTSLTGPMAFAAGQSLLLDFSGEPWFTTTTGNALNYSSSAAVQVSGRGYYTQS